MKDLENIETLYLYEQNLLKNCANNLIEASDEILHDNLLCIFDNVDELNRKLLKYLKTKKEIKKEQINRKQKEYLYEELDSLLLKINE